MGAVTLYHPIPLSVIRGSAEYSGWKFGRIIQLCSDEESGTAAYSCHIERMPEGLGIYPVGVILTQLQHCFSADINPIRVWFTKEQHWFCEIEVQRVSE